MNNLVKMKADLCMIFFFSIFVCLLFDIININRILRDKSSKFSVNNHLLLGRMHLLIKIELHDRKQKARENR
jgi:hypothetical protein